MKKLVTIALLCAMLLSCFAGCAMQKGEIYVADAANVEEAAFDATKITAKTAINTAGGLYNKDTNAAGTYSEYTGEKKYGDVTDWSANTAWYLANTTKSEYVINTADELAGFFHLRANKDSNGNYYVFTNQTIKLARDMDMKGYTMQTINGSSYFAGCFDGQGHVINDLHMESSGSATRGIFGPAQGADTPEGATTVYTSVVNVSVINSSISVVSVSKKNGAKTNTGGIFTYVKGNSAEEVRIDNVYNDIDIYFASATANYTTTDEKSYATSIKSAGYNIGGFVGFTDESAKLKISNSIYAGRIETNSYNVGGFVGYVSNASTVVVDNCQNVGEMIPITSMFMGGPEPGIATFLNAMKTNTRWTKVGENTYCSKAKLDVSSKITNWGGIVGQVKSTGGLTVKNCQNDVDINVPNGLQLGGILGREENASVTIENCLNTGNINGKTYLGGILACTKDSTAVLTNADNQGDIIGTGETIGGIMGYVLDGSFTLDGCDSEGNVTATKQAGGIVGYAKENTGSGESEYVIKNSNVNKGIINAESSGYAGGIIARVDKAKKIEINTCSVAKDVTINTKENSGGITGYITDVVETKVVGCTFSGIFNADRASGGIIGYYDIDKGVAEPSALVENCGITAEAVLNIEITTGNPSAGGIVGRVRSAAFEMKGCNMAGKLTVTFTTPEEDVSQKMAAGGLIGILFDDAGAQSPVATGSVTNCTVTGTLRFLDNTDALCTGAIFVGGTANYTADTTNITYSGLTCAGVTVDTSAVKKGEKGTPMQALQNGNGPTVVGYQLRDAYASEGSEEGAAKTLYDIRYVAVLNDIENAEAAGFKVTLIYKDAEGNKVVKVQDQIVYAKNVYETIKGEKVSYTAASFQGDYLVTLVIEGVDVNYTTKAGTLEVLLTPFTATDADNINYGMTADHGKIVIAAPAA